MSALGEITNNHKQKLGQSQTKVALGQTSVFNFLLSEPSLSFIKKK